MELARYARVVDGAVSGDPPDLPGPPETCFPPSEAALYFRCPDSVRDAWIFNGKTFSEPVDAVDEARVRAYIAAAGQHEAAVSTVEWKGKRYQADLASRVSMVLLLSTLGPDDKISWIAADNSLVEMTSVEFRGFTGAVALAVSAARLRFRAEKERIAAARSPTEVRGAGSA